MSMSRPQNETWDAGTGKNAWANKGQVNKSGAMSGAENWWCQQQAVQWRRLMQHPNQSFPNGQWFPAHFSPNLGRLAPNGPAATGASGYNTGQFTSEKTWRRHNVKCQTMYSVANYKYCFVTFWPTKIEQILQEANLFLDKSCGL